VHDGSELEIDLNRWIRNLSFARKLVLVGIAALVPLLIVTGLFLSEKQRDISLGERELAGLHRYGALETLLLPLGMHEIWRAAQAAASPGAAAAGGAAAPGNAGLEGAAGELQIATADIERALSVQDAQSEDYGAPAGEDARRWNEIKTAWDLLRRNSAASLSEIERAHAELRGQILAYRDYIADTSGLTLDSTPLINFVIDATVLQWPDFESDLAEMRSHAVSVALAPASRSSKVDFEQILHSQVLASGALEKIAADMHRAAQSGAAGEAWRISAQGALGMLSSDFDAWCKYVRQSVLGGTASDPLDAVVRNATQLHSALDGFRAPLEQAAEQQLRRKLSQLRSLRDELIVMVTLALILAVAIICVVSSGTVGEMNEVVAVVSRLAEGDYGHEIVVQGSDEFSQIAQALAGMQEKLRDVLQGVKSSSFTVATAARQISAGTEDLSARTEQQAANLEETASSMEHMTSTVRQNADNARLASTLAQAARDQAEHGGVVVEKAVAAMGAIDVSSKRIADIISVIDEIAFQTNLLALNAAVEAARAGDQGRGFAVVAGEVRNLAQRSASAAKEIKALISDSVSKVAEGGRLVSESGRYLGEIVAAVKKVSDVVGEISSASQEQAASAEQISRAVTQMDQSTQQNAAMVEQANAAAASMSEQAVRLSELTAFFRFKDADQARDECASAPPRPLIVAAAPAAAAPRASGTKLPDPARSERRGASRPWVNPVAAAASGSHAPASPAPSSDWSEF